MSRAAAQSANDPIGRPITSVRVEQEGRLVTDQQIIGLIETRVTRPLSMADVRNTIDHLYGIGRFDDVQVSAEVSGAGLLVKYLLVPSHPVSQVVLRGELGLPETEVLQAISQRYGELPPLERLDEVAAGLRTLYRDYGYIRASIKPSVDVHHSPDRSTVIFAIEPGVRARVGSVRIEGVPENDKPALVSRLGLSPGRPCDQRALRTALDKYEQELRHIGYYEARADLSQEYSPAGDAIVTVAVDRGPHVTVDYTGDRLPTAVTTQLVPIQQEASVDEDLLETSTLRIEDYLKKRGYRDAGASYERRERDNELVITFTISRGARYVVDSFESIGNQTINTSELRTYFRVKPGDPFVQGTLDSAVDAIRELYRMRGFSRVRLEPSVEVVGRPPGNEATSDARVRIGLTVTEGARTLVGSLTVEGNTAVKESDVRIWMGTSPGRAFSQVQLATDQDRIQNEYLNRGYQSVVVEPRVTLGEGDTRADVRILISEGPQVMIDKVIILGNDRTSASTIERALTLHPGAPLGYAARLESQQRLAALGLFRRVQISEHRHGSAARSDIVVQVDEAPPTTIGYGGGLEAGSRLRTDAFGQAAERFDLGPRGFIEIGRRNLWGKNRSVDLFTRVSLRGNDELLSTGVVATRYGLSEYRIVGTYREPRVFNSAADLQLNGVLEQAIRSSFEFRSRGATAQTGFRLPGAFRITANYSFRHTKLFNEQYGPDEAPLIDRLFPQVRLSTFGEALFYDTRNETLDPDRGVFVAIQNDVAAHAYGSEVAYIKTSVQVSTYRRLATPRRVVLALNGRVGAAHGFDAAVNDQLPASERFFAGGDTTVRGFSLDRLGDASTITPNGFPTGGNGLIVVNAELRVAVVGPFTAAGFFDAGNVFLNASDLNILDLRSAAGFGIRYKSPVGPIRVDLGFNLHPRELIPGELERRTVLHISLGQPF
jgi:outer membrane protein assembly complex protein YaeT